MYRAFLILVRCLCETLLSAATVTVKRKTRQYLIQQAHGCWGGGNDVVYEEEKSILSSQVNSFPDEEVELAHYTEKERRDSERERERERDLTALVNQVQSISQGSVYVLTQVIFYLFFSCGFLQTLFKWQAVYNIGIHWWSGWDTGQLLLTCEVRGYKVLLLVQISYPGLWSLFHNDLPCGKWNSQWTNP